MPDEAPARLRLSRASRMRQAREFTFARSHGYKAAKGCLAVNWLPLPAGSISKLGVITSRKLGKATIRARARRLLRQAFRLHQHELSAPIALVLIARASIVGRQFGDVERDFLFLMQQAKLLKTNG